MACISSKDTFFLLAEITVQLNFIVILLRTVWPENKLETTPSSSTEINNLYVLLTWISCK